MHLCPSSRMCKKRPGLTWINLTLAKVQWNPCIKGESGRRNAFISPPKKNRKGVNIHRLRKSFTSLVKKVHKQKVYCSWQMQKRNWFTFSAVLQQRSFLTINWWKEELPRRVNLSEYSSQRDQQGHASLTSHPSDTSSFNLFSTLFKCILFSPHTIPAPFVLVDASRTHIIGCAYQKTFWLRHQEGHCFSQYTS